MKLKMLATAVTLGAASLFSVPATAADATLPSYAKVSGISGNLSSVGSDTLANMMTFWAEEFKRNYPNINIQIQAAGSSTAPPSLPSFPEASSSGMSAAPTPARSPHVRAPFPSRTMERCSWTKSATCPRRCRSTCCGSCRTGKSDRSGPIATKS